ncbi:MAG TPA: SdrD B-like domain-containing protein [Ignavibacteriales bacterium]|nr:SdrD B-like domain-containing protein [Ignavibacteriales bacterium]
MKRLHVFVMLIMACFWVLSGSVQAQTTWDIGNLVWNDLNKNGVQDLGEPGLPGIPVELYTCGPFTGPVSTSDLSANSLTPLATTNTDLNGNYSFGNLPAGLYFVKFKVPSGWAVSPMFQGTSDEKDSDIFPYLDHTGVIKLDEHQTSNYRLGLDAGLFEIQECDLVTIGDMVFNDCNHNGVMDGDEKGIAGVCIKLYACDILPMDGFDLYSTLNRKHCCGIQIAETVTDLNGKYSFTSVLPGEYCVEVKLPHGYKGVVRPGCADVCNLNDANMTGCMTFNACTKNLDIDFAVCHDGCDLPGIGDLVWKDSNEDGIQNMNESGFPGIKVSLYACNCGHHQGISPSSNECKPMKVGSVTTDANGLYHFPNLIPGAYQIKVDAPLGYAASPADMEVANDPNYDEDCNDSDIDPGFASYWFSVYDEVNNCIDAGLYYDPDLVASISNFVWRDDDGDGVQDPREVGVPDVTLKLYECKCACTCPIPVFEDMKNETATYCADWELGKLVATTKTDADGYYKFNNIVPGKKYAVQIVVPPCFMLSPYRTGCFDENSDFHADTKTTNCIWLSAGWHINFIDAGLIPTVTDPGTVGDMVFEDLNQNGIQDCEEPGICGVTVELHACDGGATVATTKTDAAGKYLFTNVPTEGTYFVKFVLPGQFTFTAKDQGNDDGKDSDPCPDKGITDNFTLMSGQSTLILDAGMIRANCTVSNYAWEDKNDNKLMDEGEGIANVKVELHKCSDGALVQSAATGSDGRFTFSNILADSYYLKITAPEHYVVLSKGSDDGVDASSQTCFDLSKDATSIGEPIALKYTVGVEGRTGIPTEYAMDQNFPNPFNPSTTIQFAVPQAGQYMLKVYNMLGQEVSTLLNGELNAGYHSVVFDASKLTSGVYIYRLSGTNVVITRKMMLNK